MNPFWISWRISFVFGCAHNPPVKKLVRVMLLEVPQLLRGILEHAIQLQSGCELMKGTRQIVQTLKNRSAAPDIVILGLSAEEDAELVPALFGCWPATQVMTVSHTGEEATMYELQLHVQTLPDPSLDEIVERIRRAVEESRTAVQE
jgi:hypothetical protein